MFENFRKSLADTAKELPKEERKEFLESTQQSEAYEKAKKEHLEKAKEIQKNWTKKLDRLIKIENCLSNQNEWSPVSEGKYSEAIEQLKVLNDKLKLEEIPWRLPTEKELKRLFYDTSETGTEESDIMGIGIKEKKQYPALGDSYAESDRFYCMPDDKPNDVRELGYRKDTYFHGAGMGPYWGEFITIVGLENFNKDYVHSIIFTREKLKSTKDEISGDEI